MQSGRLLGAYRVLEKLGEGGMGEVYKAHDTRLDRIVAVKILSPEVATPERLQRFEQEARSASALNHPNILTIHDVGREGDIAYFAMEWVDGQTLRDLIGSGRVPLRRVIQLSHQVAEGLAKAHAAGIVHRDLKPENVMVSADGFAKIVDFGIAKLAEGAAGVGDPAEAMTQTRGTRPGMVLGTLGYMSPEQVTGRIVDYRSDQFALGLLIYELATGTRPFERESTAQSLAATIEAEPMPIDALNPQVPPHLAAIVARCLAKDPADRYESTRDLARDLKGIAETTSRGAVAVSPPWHSGRIYAVAGTLAVIAAAVAGWWYWSPARAVPTAPPRPLLAVRAFRSLSPDPAQAYFAAGMTEEIRGQLSQVSSLRLLSRNAVDAAPGGDGARVVRDLGVTQLVDGSVRVDGNRVRISAELIDAATQQTLWSQQYDRELADILAVQSDVAMQIAHALRASLSPAEKQRIERPPTDNAAAYALYLQAQPMPSFDRAKNLAAIDLLRKTVAMDPRFAAARARIAYRLVIMGYYDDPSYIDQGIAEAQASLGTNPSLPMAHFTLATGYAMKGMDAQARLSFLKALELDPNHVNGMFNLSVLEANFGNLDQSLAWARRGFALSGKKGNDFYHMAVPLLQLRAEEEGQRWLAEAERRFPDFPRTQLMQVVFDTYAGRLDQASKRMSALVARSPADEEVKFMRADLAFLTGSTDLGPALDALSPASATNTMVVAETVGLRRSYVAGLRGDTTRAAALLDRAELVAREKMERGDRTPGLRVEMAAAALLRRDQAAALDWLARAFEAGYRDYGLLERDPIFARIEPAAKFREIVDRMRRDVDAQRARARAGNLLDIEPLLAPAR